MTDDELAAQLLGEAVLLGDEPTPQELALGEAVAAHLSQRQLQVGEET